MEYIYEQAHEIQCKNLKKNVPIQQILEGVKTDKEINIVTKNMETNKIFISYSSDDRELQHSFAQRLKIYLASAKHKYETVWTDVAIPVGGDWNTEIQTALKQSNIGILLVSPMFLGSKYCMGDEFRQMLDRRKTEGYTIVPIKLRECHFQNIEELAKIQFVRTYKSEYGVTNFGEEGMLMPFDELADIPNPSKFHLNKYLLKVTEAIDNAIALKLHQQKS
jgi:hypothetical protein